jgi:hypothetical protein
VAALCLLFVLLTMLYLVEPARAMPSIVPGSAPLPGFAHRYLQATGAGLLSLFLGAAALVRWRLHRQSRAIRRHPPVSPDDVNLYIDV